MRTGSGTSSSLVNPPSGCSSSTWDTVSCGCGVHGADRVLEAFGNQLGVRVLHQQRVAVVDRIAQLEGIHRIGMAGLELRTQLQTSSRTIA